MSSIKNSSVISRKQIKGSGRTYWRSLNEFAGSAEYEEMMKREFSAVATEAVNDTTRRDFLRVMGASLALAGIGITGCTWPREKIAPFANRPEGMSPGTPVQFATTMELFGYGTGLLATSYDGRPIKVDGNPRHPASLGGASSLHQASVLNVYDIDRLKSFVDRSAGAETQRDRAAFVNWVENNRVFAGDFAVLTESSSSPTLQALRNRMGSRVRWFEYEPVSRDNEREAMQLLYGRACHPVMDMSNASVVASFDDDFLFSHPASVMYSKQFAAARDLKRGAPLRMYCFESAMSVTGANADHRRPLRSAHVGAALAALAAEIFVNKRHPLPPNAQNLSGVLQQFSSVSLDASTMEGIKLLASDLISLKGKAAVTVGARQPAPVHILAAMINEAMQNTGYTVNYVEDPVQERYSHSLAFSELKSAVSGGVRNLLIIGGDPVFNAPADSGLVELLGQLDNVVHLTSHANVTSGHAGWVVPRAEYLESWGDAYSWDGSYSITQPLIEPLYDGMSAIEMLALCAGDDRRAHDLVMDTFVSLSGSMDAEADWRRVLHDGVSTVRMASHTEEGNFSLGMGPISSLGELPAAQGLELSFYPDNCILDGRFANNGWLQEAPDPVTKLTWDNAAVVSFKDAGELGVKDGDVVNVAIGNVKTQLPIVILPGQAEGSVSLAMGYGQNHIGRIADGVGSDIFMLRDNANPNYLQGGSLSKAGRSMVLASVQDHHAIDELGAKERERRIPTLIREADFRFYKEQPDFAQHMVHEPVDTQLFVSPQYTGHRWGMSIDLNACTGCGACIVACVAENNIPVVGKQRVIEGRELHWIRVDRYFSGDVANPQSVHMPVACQQCENAPCEQVCPVAATVHSDEGLNDMVYNRCVGTRYCSNNCPYKVRRFNYFNYQKTISDTERLVKNPDVTVRSRGVMEKCTYCVQRIQHAKIKAKVQGRDLKDGEIRTACQQTCPTDAIVFGDLSMPESEVSKRHADGRTYEILAELSNRTRTRYMARVRNFADGSPELAADQARHARGHGGGHGESHDEGHGEQATSHEAEH
ncbi:TAT-variant-translocated molybdopterin oxidoreductase [bacterium]|nr:TAT-variant-translocated molybdopterin oxidoreductase [bacterium]